MNLAEEYWRQAGWRNWGPVFEALPALDGQTVFDLGCGPGEQAAAMVSRGGRVVGFDLNEDLLRAARERVIPNAEFRAADLRRPGDPGRLADGLWASFAAAYLMDLPAALRAWSAYLRPGGWAAVTEIDDLFGHEPTAPRTRALFEECARRMLAAGYYDFHKGRKLCSALEQAGFSIRSTLDLADPELAFDGPARADVLRSWEARLDRMRFLCDLCGAEFEALRSDFLGCLARADHRSFARVVCCIGVKEAA